MSEQLVHRNCGGAIAIFGRAGRMAYWCRACGAHLDIFTDATVIELDLAHAGPLSWEEASDFLDGATSPLPSREKAS